MGENYKRNEQSKKKMRKIEGQGHLVKGETPESIT